VRTQIAILEYMRRHTEAPGMLDRYPVQGSAIAEQHQVGDAPVRQLVRKESRPLIHVAGKIRCRGQIPEQAVAAVEIDAVNRVPEAREGFSQVGEKPRGQALQK
jgi:hypothetical protein